MERVREAISRLASSMPSGGGPGPMGRALGLGAAGSRAAREARLERALRSDAVGY